MNRQNTGKRLKSGRRGFEEAFNCIPRNKILYVRKEIMTRLNWSVSVFYYKKRGDTPIWENEVPVIEQIFSMFRIDPWTGETI